MRDTANQVVLGTFVATLVHCLLVLCIIRRGDEVAFGSLRPVATGHTLAGVTDSAFNQIRQSARSNPAVAIRMLDAIARIAGHVRRAPEAACLSRHADMIVRSAREAVPEEGGRLAV